MGQFSWECCVVKGREGERFLEKPAVPVSQRESGISSQSAGERNFQSVSGRAELPVSYPESGISS